MRLIAKQIEVNSYDYILNSKYLELFLEMYETNCRIDKSRLYNYGHIFFSQPFTDFWKCIRQAAE